MAAISIARVYQRSFETHPHTTLAITGGLFNALGDFVAQISQSLYLRHDNQHRDYDLIRTLRFFCFGFTFTPFIGRWNVFLEKMFPLRTTKGTGKVSLKALSKRVACDQLVMAPFGLGIFIGSMGIMEGRDARRIYQKFDALYKPALLTNWQVWPMAQLINFRYMPLPYRVPFQSTCGVFWTLYLSIINSSPDAQAVHGDDAKKL
jgi:protein Mpv17